MKYLIVSSLLFLSFSAKAESSYFDLMPLQIQLRYEDTLDQTRGTQTYKSYALAYQYHWFRSVAELNNLSDSSGNKTVGTQRNIVEFLFSAEYRVYQLLHKENNLSLDFFANAWGGQTRTDITTTFLSVQNTSSSDSDLVWGFGASALGRFRYLMIEADLKMLYSQNMNPQQVPVFTFKVGAGIPF
jgi:hypothetical protein